VWKWESYLVETGTFLSNLREGTPEKPKFEQTYWKVTVHSIIGSKIQKFFQD
jgi:hypothetical protein